MRAPVLAVRLVVNALQIRSFCVLTYQRWRLRVGEVALLRSFLAAFEA